MLAISSYAGTLRHAWAFLATLNDLPAGFHEVRATKGAMMGRNYRRFLDHRTITLKVPVISSVLP
jgi:hypothetical protein